MNLAKVALVVLSATTITLALSTNAQAERGNAISEPLTPNSTIPLKDLPALGSVPTYYYEMSFLDMAQMLADDIHEGRKHFSKDKPSQLDRHIVRMENIPGIPVDEGRFAAGNPYICITIVNIRVPSLYSNQQGGFDGAARNCTTDTPKDRSSPLLAEFYATNGVSVIANTTATKVQLIRSTSSIMGANEWVGTSFFDALGNYGRLQEVVWITATYLN